MNDSMENEYREEGSSIVGPKKQKKQSKSSLTSSELNILKEQGIEYLEEQRNKTTVQFVDVMCGDAWKKKGYHGPVICNYADGSEYQGEWQDGKRHGTGTYISPTGTRYEGEWENDEASGHGVCHYADGMKYDGQFESGERHGKGILISPEGDRYEGQFKYDLVNGEGIYTWGDGVRSEGEFREGKPWNVVGYDEYGEICGLLVDGKLQEVYTGSHRCATQSEYQEEETKLLTENRR
jgi:hypothetical protein